MEYGGQAGDSTAELGGQDDAEGGAAPSLGGTTAQGGAPTAGGATAAGGTTAQGGASTAGGATAAGGTTNAGSGGQLGQGGAAGEGGVDPMVDANIPDPGTYITSKYKGTLAIQTEADMVSFCGNYDGVEGDVVISGTAIENLDALSCLVEVTGELQLDAPNLVSANLPNLVAVGSFWTGNLFHLTEIAFPKLATASSTFWIVSVSVTALEFPSLRAVGEELMISASSSLRTISLPVLTHVGSDANVQNSMLTDLSLPDLVYVGGGLDLSSMTLTHLGLSSITEVGTSLVIEGGSFADVDLSNLTRVSSLLMTGDDLSVDLVALDLPHLISAADLVISGFPALTQISAPWVPELYKLEVRSNPLLNNLSVPSASITKWLTLYLSTTPAEIDLASLTEADYVSLSLNGLASIRLPALTKVTTDLSIKGPLGVDFPELLEVATATIGDMTTDTATQGFVLSAPKLTTAGTLGLGSGLTEVSFPALASFDSLYAYYTSLTQLAVDEATAGQVQLRHNPDLVSVSLPNLATTSGFEINASQLLETLALPLLAEVTGTLDLYEVDALNSLSLPSLTSAGTVRIEFTGLTDGLDAPNLTTLGSLELRSSGCRSFSLPSVTAIANKFSVANDRSLESVSLPNAVGNYPLVIDVRGNTALTAFDLSAVVQTDEIYILDNAALASVDGLTGLTRTFALTITDNPELASLTGLDNLDQTGSLTIYGNTTLTDDAVTAFVDSIATITGTVTLVAP